MKNYFLFPTWFKILGITLTVPGILLGAMYVIWDYSVPFLKVAGSIKGEVEYITNELAVFLTVIGLLFIGFSKQVKEDELVAKMRMNALQWGIYTYLVYYIMTLIGSEDLLSLIKVDEYRSELNILLPLLLFNLRFYYLLKIKPDYFLTGDIELFNHQPYLLIGRALTLMGLAYLAYILLSNQLFDVDNVYPKISVLSFILGMFLWAFSRRKHEDEGTNQIRVNAMQGSFYAHYFIILLGTATMYSLSYLLFLGLVQFTLLLFHILLLEGLLWKERLALKNEDKPIQSGGNLL